MAAKEIILAALELEGGFRRACDADLHDSTISDAARRERIIAHGQRYLRKIANLWAEMERLAPGPKNSEAQSTLDDAVRCLHSAQAEFLALDDVAGGAP